jgi:integrase
VSQIHAEILKIANGYLQNRQKGSRAEISAGGGIYLRFNQTKATWILRVKDKRHAVKRSLGDLADCDFGTAFIRAQAIKQDFDSGQLPAQETPAAYFLSDQVIISELLELYMHEELQNSKNKKLKASSARTQKSAIRNHIQPKLGRYRPGEISDTLLQKFLKSLLEKQHRNLASEATKHKVYSILRKFFAWLRRNKVSIDSHLLADVTKPSPQPRQQAFTIPQLRLKHEWLQDKIDAILQTQKHKSALKYIAMRVKLFTAGRIGEVCSINVTDIDINYRFIEVAASRNKSGVNFDRYLTEEVQALLKLAHEISGGKKYIFKSGYCNYGKEKAISVSSVKSAFYECRDALNIDRDIHLHDVRRSKAEKLTERQSQQSLEVATAALGHLDVETTKQHYIPNRQKTDTSVAERAWVDMTKPREPGSGRSDNAS